MQKRKRDRLKARVKRYMPVPLAVRTSDLWVRLGSALVMIAVAAGVLWAGDPWLDVFILAVVAATLIEMVRLVNRAAKTLPGRIVGIVAGTVYVGAAGYALTRFPPSMIVAVVGAVIFVDSFAYFFGRTLGGPKIAPRISPSKTWAGLLGGAVGASLWTAGWSATVGDFAGERALGFSVIEILQILALGSGIAIAAQAGDFFESWLKRRAGVKDSSNLIPGHGGVFDRTDGMIPVVLLVALIFGVPQ